MTATVALMVTASMHRWRGAVLPSWKVVGTDPLHDLPAFSAAAGATCAMQIAHTAGRPKSVVKWDGTRHACCATRSWRSFKGKNNAPGRRVGALREQPRPRNRVA